ncbi:MAG: hypothetical protein A2623_03885 [Caulobacterales bacterium RIFCSPHIGHO2_01_FULL_70_19]|nr:MAG: hypothetical protein A2623_03885 [Caulobacterales bacterium RIFCSPHIGHO2_01_FULL_70_19]
MKAMKVRAARWGNSVAVRLPRRAVEALGLEPGQDMDMELRGETLELTVRRRPEVTLDWIVSEIDRLGSAGEPETVDWGLDRGDEILHDRP